MTNLEEAALSRAIHERESTHIFLENPARRFVDSKERSVKIWKCPASGISGQYPKASFHQVISLRHG
jgi:hypothetical protein